MNTSIESLYDYVLQQMAAESYFEGVDLGDATLLRDRLVLGTNRVGFQYGPPDLNQGYLGYTRMTALQATEFLQKFSIVHQWSDDPTIKDGVVKPRPAPKGIDGKPKLNSDILANTGLSATLIRKKDEAGNPTNEYTLAVRSTEFRNWADGGDGERDKTGADIKDVAFNGFALAQLDALQQYYQWLKDNKDAAGNPLLPPGAKLDVTGYSLGGHLATVFTEVHQNDPDIQFGQTVTFNGAGRGSWDFSQGSLADMIAYYHQVLNNPSTPPPRPLTDQELLFRDRAVAIAGQAFDQKSVYTDARYLWAVMATKAKYNLGWQALGDEARTGTLADARITQVFGYETIDNVNFTANAGIHGPALRVGIESQPLVDFDLSANPFNSVRAEINDFGYRYADSTNYFGPIEHVEFADGTTWDLAELRSRVTRIEGTPSADTLSGASYSETLVGYAGNDSISGMDGDDLLDGGAGADNLKGGTGNDVYVVDATTDSIQEFANEGSDAVRSSVTWTLGSNLENLTLTGTAPINGTGNTLANVIVGNSGNNSLNGGAGDDTYDGGAGNDTFIDTSTTSNDTYRWGIGSGLDTLTDAGGSLDHVDLYAGITKSQLKFMKSANDLQLSVIGQTDKLTMKNWYVGTANRIEEFRMSDGSKTMASEVQGLLSAMAAFVPMDSTLNDPKAAFIDMPLANPLMPDKAWM